ncbi:MAG: hypothetical protein GC162_09730 [Planctomycetes bacterium]|nr:hypothetical protein [Planctomycetota bacterium]
MFAKLVTMTLLLVCLASAMLVLRQHRIQLANDSAVLHQQIVHLRQEIWDAQGKAANVLEPRQLRNRIDAAQLALEPVAPSASPATRFASTDSPGGR